MPKPCCTAADCSWRGNKADRVISYAAKAAEAATPAPNAKASSDSEWAAEKAALIGRANFYTGVGYTMEMRYGPANKALKAALPAIKGNSQLYAIALFDLGLANYSSANRSATRHRCARACITSSNRPRLQARCRIRHRATPSWC